MRDRPRLSTLDLWGSKEQEVLGVLRDALAQLSADPGPDADEDSINRKLLRFIDGVIAIRRRESGCTLEPPAHEMRSSPAPSNPARVKREFKRPDFVWLWSDDLAIEPTLSRLEFVVECKRLGADPFPRRYVRDGILRFTNDSHAYGMDMRSGVMVGYLQLITIDAAVEQVNAVATSHGIPALALSVRLGDDGATLAHSVVRSYAVSPFSLTHLWARWS